MLNQALIWTLVSIIIYAIARNIDALEHEASAGDRGQARSGLLAWFRSPLGRMTLRYAFLFGIPFVAIMLRIPSYQDLGFPVENLDIGSEGGFLSGWKASAEGPSWSRSILLGFGTALLVSALVVANRLWLAAARGWAGRPQFRLPDSSRVLAELESSFLDEMHWAFYRAGILSIGLRNQGLAVFIALGFLALEAWSDPKTRKDFHKADASQAISQKAALALLSALVFLQTGSSLVAWWAGLGTRLAVATLDLENAPVEPAEPEPPAKPESPVEIKLDELELIEPTIV